MTDPKGDQRVTIAVDPVKLRVAERPSIWTNFCKAGRASLRVLRPLAMPFLRRFEARVQTAVWRTGLVEDVSRIGVRADQILTEIRQQAEAPKQSANQLDAALLRHAEAVIESTKQANKAFQEHARLMEQYTASTRDNVQAINAAVARLEAASARHTVQIEALGRSVPHLKMTALRVEEALAIEAKRLSLMHEALCAVLASLEPQVRQVDEGFVWLRTAFSEISAATVRHTAQLANRNTIPLLGTEYAARTPNGYVVVPADDIGLLIHLAEGTGHALGTIKTLETLLDPGDNAIDVGAHIGMMAVPMARRVGPSGSVHLFEPSPKTAACLRQTLLLNGLQPWTTVVESAVNDQPGRATLHLGMNSTLNSLRPTHPETASGIEVDVTRLDDAILPGTSVSVLKIAVEGAELGVLNGMPRILAENPDLIIIAGLARSHLERSGSAAAGWLGAFASVGKDVALRIDEATGACTPVTPAELSAAAEPMNLVLARHSALRLTRLSASP